MIPATQRGRQTEKHPDSSAFWAEFARSPEPETAARPSILWTLDAT